MTIWWRVLLIPGAYLLGSVPASYLAARLFRGIDLRKYGTAQVGGGNLWRMTSWRLGLPVGVFDLSKGLVMVLIAHSAGLGVTPQIAVGAAAIIGHNWPVFLRFHGGRGMGTTIGVVFILPLINNISPWPTLAFFSIILTGSLILRSSALPALASTAALPLASWAFHGPLSVTLGFLAILLIIVLKRLTAQNPADTAPIKKRTLLLNRLLFDRDIRDKNSWMYRKPAGDGSQQATNGTEKQG